MMLSIPALAVYSLLLAFPALIFYRLGIHKLRSLLFAFLRMIIQLTLIGVYLGGIFEYNSMLINVVWLIVMVLVANTAILRQSGLKWRVFAFSTVLAYLITLSLTMVSLLILLRPSVLFSARHFIPLGGMVLGNILRSSIVALERFYSSIHSGRDSLIHAFMLGAGRWEAVRPYLRQAVQGALAPQIAVVATMGLVSLPGMMTGQLLGGASPEAAVRYQVMIMIAIFFTASVSILLALLFSLPRAFDKYHRLRPGLLEEK